MVDELHGDAAGIGLSTDASWLVTMSRLSIVGASAFLSINLWTGFPLAALWVGSVASGHSVLSMKAVIVVLLVLALLVVAAAFALTWLSNTYDRLIERPQGEARATWLRSMRAEPGHVSSRVGETAVERVVMVSVYLAVLTFLVWFLFFAHYTVG